MATAADIAKGALSGGVAGSALGPGGAAAGLGIGLVGGIVGWLIENHYEEEAQRILKEARDAYGSLDDSAIEAAAAQVLGPSALGQIKADPTYRAAQDDALAQLRDISRSGMSLSDRATLADATDAAGQEARSATEGVLQGARARGVAGSGAELAAALQAGQSGANRASRTARGVAGDASDRALRALSQSATLAGNLESTDYNRQANTAVANDQIARFNNDTQYNRANDAYNRQLGDMNRRYNQARDQAGEQRAAGQREGGMARDVGALTSSAVQGISRSSAQPAAPRAPAPSRVGDGLLPVPGLDTNDDGTTYEDDWS